MDSTWPFNLECNDPPTNTPQYYDKAIIPQLFYNAVINRDTNALVNIIKYNPVLSVAVANFYITTLANAFYTKKNANFGAPVRIRWKVQSSTPIIMNFNDQVDLYVYVTRAPWVATDFGFLVNTINNYLVNLRAAMQRINNNYPANSYFKYGVNVTNNAQMKVFITKFIPGIRFQ
jgi:hypothetical protein